MNKVKLSIVSALLLGTVSSLSAMQFQTVGYKSISMGGASVANSSGSLSSYNNPALLAKSKYDVEISVSGGASYYDHGAGASMKSLQDTGFIDSMDRATNDTANITQSDIDNIYAGKDVILGMDGDAVSIQPQASVGFQIGSFGFGVYGTSDAVVTAKVSQAHDKMILEDTANPGNYIEVLADGTTAASNIGAYQASSMEYALNNGLTYADVQGIGVVEVPLSYGHALSSSVGTFYVGGSLKYMQATTYTEKLKIDNTGNSATKNDKTSNGFGVDLGFAYEPKIIKDMTIGLVAKNLNSPSFDTVSGTQVVIDPMVRVGIAYDIFESLEFAADFDVTSNKTFIADLDNQMIGGGLAYHPASWFSLRGGLMQNMAANDKSGLVYTAGLGFGLKWFQIDLSAQMASQSSTVNGTTYPQEGKVNLALVSRW
ncbi:conjugal transfer protein TraF [Sulfurimonas sp. SAG-AH-194-C20]|nr:conjugal transfer protein TraF [Sulfurimonas sp. SAG-AH-194-C20]MDF1878326.1 conjugal transfer protein TraF [Sulfurimonas sp. SAG-AH-194-C20]